jgi:hypothetical protein
MKFLKNLFLLLIIQIVMISCKPTGLKTVSGAFNKILEPVTVSITPDTELGEMITTEDEKEIVVTITNNSSDELRDVNLVIDTSEKLIDFQPYLDGTSHSPGHNGTCQTVLAAGAECNFKLFLIPRKQGEFNINMTLLYVNKIQPAKREFNFHLIAGEPAFLNFSNDQASYSLGVVEQTEAIQKTLDLEVVNTGGLPARNIVVDFEDGSTKFFNKPFSLISHNCPKTLFSKAKCQLHLAYTPRNNNYTDPEEINTASLIMTYENDPSLTQDQLSGYFNFTSSTIEAKFKPNYKVVDYRINGTNIVAGNKRAPVSIRVTNQGYREGILNALIFRKKTPDDILKGDIAAICTKATAGNILNCQKKRMSDYPLLFSATDIANEITRIGHSECTTNCDNNSVFDFPFIIEDLNSCFGSEVVSMFNADTTHSANCVYKITYWPSTDFTKANHDLHNFDSSTMDFRYDSRWKGNVTYVTNEAADKKGLFQNVADYLEKAKPKIVKVEMDGVSIDLDNGQPIIPSNIQELTSTLTRIELGPLAKLAVGIIDPITIKLVIANVGEETLKMTELRDGKTGANQFSATADSLANGGLQIGSYYKGLTQTDCGALNTSTFDIALGEWSSTCSISFEISPVKQLASGGKTGTEIEDSLMYDSVVTTPNVEKIKKFLIMYTDGSTVEDNGAAVTNRSFEADLKSLLVAKGKLQVVTPTNDYGTITVGEKKVLHLKLKNSGTGPLSAIQFRYDAKKTPYNFALEVGNTALTADQILANEFSVSTCSTPTKIPALPAVANEEWCPIKSTEKYGYVSDVEAMDQSFKYKISRYADNGENIKTATGDAAAVKDCADIILKHNLTLPFTAPAGHAKEDYLLDSDSYCYLRIEAKMPLNSLAYNKNYPLALEYQRFWATKNTGDDLWSKSAPQTSDPTFKFNTWDGFDNSSVDAKSLPYFGYPLTTYPSFTLKSAWKTPANIGVSDINPIASLSLFRPVISYPEITSSYPTYSKLFAFTVPNDISTSAALSSNIFTNKTLELGIAAAGNISPLVTKENDLKGFYQDLGAEFFATNTQRYYYFLGAFQKGVDNYATITFKNFGQTKSNILKLTELPDLDSGIFTIQKFKDPFYTMGDELTSGLSAGSTFDLVTNFKMPTPGAKSIYQKCYQLSYKMQLVDFTDKEYLYEFCLVAKAVDAPLLKIEYQNWDISYDPDATPKYTASITSPLVWNNLVTPLNLLDNLKDENGGLLIGKSYGDPDRSIFFNTVSGSSTCDANKDCLYDLKVLKITNTGDAALTKLETDIINTDLTVAKSGSNTLLIVLDDVTSSTTICSKYDGTAFSDIKDRIAICKSELALCQTLAKNAFCTLRVFFTPTTSTTNPTINKKFIFTYPTNATTGGKTYANQYAPIQYQGLSTTKPKVEGIYRLGIAGDPPFSLSSGIAMRTGVLASNYNYSAKDNGGAHYSNVANWSDPSATSVTETSQWWPLDLGAFANDNIATTKRSNYVLNSSSKSQIFYVNLINNTANKISFLLANSDPESNQSKQSAENLASSWYQVYPPYNGSAFTTYPANFGKSRAIIYANIGCFYGTSSKTDTIIPDNQKGFNNVFDFSNISKTCQLKVNFNGDFTYSAASGAAVCSNSGLTKGEKEVNIGGYIDTASCNPYIFRIPFYTFKRTAKSTFDLFVKGFIEPNRLSTPTAILSNVKTKYLSTSNAQMSFDLPVTVTPADGSMGSIFKYRIFWSKTLSTSTLQSPELFRYVPTDTYFKNNVFWTDVDPATTTVTLSTNVSPKTYYYVKVLAIRNIPNTNASYNGGKTAKIYYMADPKIPVQIIVTPDSNTFYADSLKILGDKAMTSAANEKYDTSVANCTSQSLTVNGYSSSQKKGLIDFPAWNIIRNAGSSNTEINSALSYGTGSVGNVPHWLFETAPVNIKTSMFIYRYDGSTSSPNTVFTDWSQVGVFNQAQSISYNRTSSTGLWTLNKIVGGDGDTIPNGMNYFYKTLPYGRARCKVDLKCPLSGLTTKQLSDTSSTGCKILPSN